MKYLLLAAIITFASAQTALASPSGHGGSDPSYGGYSANSGYGTNSNYNAGGHGQNSNYNSGNYGSNSGYGQNSGSHGGHSSSGGYDQHGQQHYGGPSGSSGYDPHNGHSQPPPPQHGGGYGHNGQQGGGHPGAGAYGGPPTSGAGYGGPTGPYVPRECTQKEQEVCLRYRTPEMCQANECCVFEWNDRRPTCTGWEDAQYNEQECSEFPREYCEKDPDCAWSKIDYECDTKFAVQQTLQQECKHNPNAEGCENYTSFASSAAIALLCCCGFCGFLGGMKFMMGSNRNMGEKDEGLMSWDKANHTPEDPASTSRYPTQSTSRHPGNNYTRPPQY